MNNFTDLRDALDTAGARRDASAATGASPEDLAQGIADLIERRIAPLRDRVMALELTVAEQRREIDQLKAR